MNSEICMLHTVTKFYLELKKNSKKKNPNVIIVSMNFKEGKELKIQAADNEISLKSSRTSERKGNR
jgi:hypothetical protein